MILVLGGRTTRYNAFANVTALVQAAGAGTYSVANVQAGRVGDRYAGWTLVVAYQDPGQPPRNLTVDDGFVTVSSGTPPITIPVSGFRTPPSGAVNTTLGFVGLRGRLGADGRQRVAERDDAERRGQSREQFLLQRDLEPRGQRHDEEPERCQQLGVRREARERERDPPEQRDVGQHRGHDQRRHLFSGGGHARDGSVFAEYRELEVGHEPHPSRRAGPARGHAALHGFIHEHRLGLGGELRNARSDPGRDDVCAGEPAHHRRPARGHEPESDGRARGRRRRVQPGDEQGGVPARGRRERDDRAAGSRPGETDTVDVRRHDQRATTARGSRSSTRRRRPSTV